MFEKHDNIKKKIKKQRYPKKKKKDQWGISLHAYGKSLSVDPSSWLDFGHAFTSLSCNGKIVAAAGLSPRNLPDDTSSGESSFFVSSPIPQSGKIYSEWVSFEQETLRTTTFTIDRDKAKRALAIIHAEYNNPKKRYKSFGHNCAGWALDLLGKVGVNTKEFRSKYVNRPGAFHQMLEDEGCGNLIVPSKDKIGVTKEGEELWHTEDREVKVLLNELHRKQQVKKREDDESKFEIVEKEKSKSLTGKKRKMDLGEDEDEPKKKQRKVEEKEKEKTVEEKKVKKKKPERGFYS